MADKSFFRNIIKGSKNKIKFILHNPYKKINLNWFKIKYYKHLSPGKIKTHILFGKKLSFFDPVQLVSGLTEIFIDEAYKMQLADCPYILDCGANIGLSVIYIKKQHPNAEIVAFEPDDMNYSLLAENMKSFGYTDVTIRKEAVWINNTQIYFSNEGSMSSKIERENSSNTTEVKAIRLKDFLTRKVDFLKIDIEGAEYTVLNDIAGELHFVKNMFLEYHGTFSQNAELTKLFSIISNCGFNYYIKEAAPLYHFPFLRTGTPSVGYDVQLNIFCFRA